MEHYPTYKYNLGNYNHAQGNKINQFSCQLYLYGYHPPLDVNLTHWASISAPTLRLTHSGSTFSQPFYLNFKNLMSNTIWTNPLNPKCNFKLCYLLSILVHKSRVSLGQERSLPLHLELFLLFNTVRDKGHSPPPTRNMKY
jgi:hypothetical protein